MAEETGVTQEAYAALGSTIIQAGRDVTITVHGPAEEQFADDLVGECPYPGMSAFELQQAKWFFGRDAVLAELVQRVDRARREGGPIIVIGASGAGKSSLLRCALIHTVSTRGYGVPGSRSWPHQVITPADIPEITGPGLLVVDQFEEIFAPTIDPARRTRFIEQLDQLSRRSITVVIGLRADFYGYCLAHPALAAALRDDPVQLEPMSADELQQAVLRPAQRVGLTVEPGLLPVLLADMGANAGPGEDTSGRLPLLAHALRATWWKRSGATLTLAGYQDTGGIYGAIATTADRTYDRLSEPARTVARSVFLRLVRIGSDTEDTRRLVPHNELSHGLSDSDAVAEVVHAYTQRRLLTQERQGLTITHSALLRAWPRLRSWIDTDRAGHVFRQELEARARAWTHTGEEASVLYRGATLAAAQTWAEEHRTDLTDEVSRFLAASHRAAAAMRRVRQVVLAVIMVISLVASGLAVVAFNERADAINQRDQAVAQLAANEARSLANSQPGLAKQLALVAYRLDPALGPSMLASFLDKPGILDAPDQITDMAASAAGGTLAFSTGSAVALWSANSHARTRITGVSAGPVALTPDGEALAAATGAGLRMWSLTVPGHPLPLPTLPVRNVTSLVVTDRLLAAGTATGAIELWDITTRAGPRQLPTLSGHPGGVDSLAFAPHRPTLASSGADHAIRLWNLVDPRHPALYSTVDGYRGNDELGSPHYPSMYHRIAFNRAGTLLAGPGDGDISDIRLWNVTNPARPSLFAAPRQSRGSSGCGGALRSSSFGAGASGDEFLATVCPGNVVLWQVPTTAADVTDIYALRGVDDNQNGPVMYQPGTQSLLHATRNGVQIWDVSDPYQPGAAATLGQLPGGFVVAMQFSGGRRRLLGTVGYGSGSLWDLTGNPPHHQIAMLPGSPDPGSGAAAFTSDGTVFADSEGDSLVLRDTTRPGAPILSTLTSQVASGLHGLAFSPDGRLLAMADTDEAPTAGPRTVKLLNVADPRNPWLIATLPAAALRVEFSPNGQLLTANTPDSLLVWNVTDPTRPTALPAQKLAAGSNASVSAFRPDGRYLAVGDDSGTIRFWQVVDDRLAGPPSTLHADAYQADDLAFSPDGRTLAWNSAGNPGATAGSLAAHVEMWDVTNPAVPALQSQFAFTDSLGAPLAFSSDGRLLATGVNDTIDIWSTDPAVDKAFICRAVGDVITPPQWAQYVPGKPYDPPCS